MTPAKEEPSQQIPIHNSYDHARPGMYTSIRDRRTPLPTCGNKYPDKTKQAKLRPESEVKESEVKPNRYRRVMCRLRMRLEEVGVEVEEGGGGWKTRA